ncbi:MAG TPA: hypothetical protein VKE24_01980 [Candidatus Acidoferrales bacterium]|nr:hypothetical protein [Candidatus Acidoferrales bacterium]
MKRTCWGPGLREGERGGARLKALFWLLLLAAGGYAAVKLLPIYLANYQLQDKLEAEARFATVNHRTDDELREVIFREIQDRDIPAKRENIKILENSPHRVSLSVDYSVDVDLKIHRLHLHFNPAAENRAVY